jgi:Tol biopolymer transport system component
MTSESTRPKALSPCSGISWSPDGRQLAFSAIQRDRASLGGTGRTNPLDLFIVDVDGGRPKRITGNPYGDEAPDWRP